MASSDGLFAEFPPVGAAEWRAQLQRDLKGEGLDSLTWKNENGFDLQPFYTAEDLQVSYEPAFLHNFWDRCVKSPAGLDDSKTNRYLLDSLNRGATSLFIDSGADDLRKILNGVQLELINVVFRCERSKLASIGSILKDSGGEGLHYSLFPVDLNDERDLAEWLAAAGPIQRSPLGKIICIDLLGEKFQGAQPYYELAIMLSAMVAWLDAAAKSGIRIQSPVSVRTSVDTRYFTSIAKLRAMRRLWQLLRGEYRLIDTELDIFVETSLSNKSHGSSYNNLLRTSVEAMAAVAGGCNNLLVHEFDVLSGGSDDSRRLALNQQLVLNHESQLSGLADVGCGSFYVESFTDALAAKALETFKKFESRGGYFACLKTGVFEEAIRSQRRDTAAQIENGEQVIVGVNKFAIADDLKPRVSISEAKKQYSYNPVVSYEGSKSQRS